jgi:hypothetical protein
MPVEVRSSEGLAVTLPPPAQHYHQHAMSTVRVRLFLQEPSSYPMVAVNEQMLLAYNNYHDWSLIVEVIRSCVFGVEPS